MALATHAVSSTSVHPIMPRLSIPFRCLTRPQLLTRVRYPSHREEHIPTLPIVRLDRPRPTAVRPGSGRGDAAQAETQS
jgi:hypothetical protein